MRGWGKMFSDSWYSLKAGCLEHGNEVRWSINGAECLDQLSKYLIHNANTPSPNGVRSRVHSIPIFWISSSSNSEIHFFDTKQRRANYVNWRVHSVVNEITAFWDTIVIYKSTWQKTPIFSSSKRTKLFSPQRNSPLL
jgi:hypothetical protein